MTSEFTIATHALVFLHHKNTWVSSEGLANNICTNPTRVRKVMAKLKKAGFVQTKEGISGGYLLEKERISLREIAEALNETIVSSNWKSGNPDMECLIASGITSVLDGVMSDLNETCLKQLETIEIHDLENQLFKK